MKLYFGLFLCFVASATANQSTVQTAQVKLLENRIAQLEAALKRSGGSVVKVNTTPNIQAVDGDIAQHLKKLSTQMRKLNRDVKAIKKSLGIKTTKVSKPLQKEQSTFGQDSAIEMDSAPKAEAEPVAAAKTEGPEKNVAEQQFKVIEILYNSTQDTKLSNTQRSQKRHELAEAIRYFLQMYGKEPQAKQAMYWLGCTYLDDARATKESEVKKSLYHNAKVALVKAYQADRTGRNTPECLLKIGEAMYYEGRTSSNGDACTIWSKLKADFPDKLKENPELSKHLQGFVSQAGCK